MAPQVFVMSQKLGIIYQRLSERGNKKYQAVPSINCCVSIFVNRKNQLMVRQKIKLSNCFQSRI